MFFTGISLASISFFSMLFVRQTVISFLVAIELLLLAVSLVGLSFVFLFDLFEGQTFCILNLTYAAAESALGLAVFVQFYRAKGRIDYFVNPILKS